MADARRSPIVIALMVACVTVAHSTPASASPDVDIPSAAPVADPVVLGRPAPANQPAPESKRAQAIRLVLDFAHALLGRPYRYGAAGPDAFDCSGFASFVWRSAGVALPRRSADQYAALPHVDLAAMEPGDLVFSGYGGVSHVGLYLGQGLMIHAPHTGRSVEVEALHSNLIGAARPVMLMPEG